MNDLLVGAPRGEVQGGLPMPGTEHVLTTVCGDAVATGAGSPGFLDQPVGGGCSFLLAPAGPILLPATLSGAGPGTGTLELEGELLTPPRSRRSTSRSWSPIRPPRRGSARRRG